MKKIHGMVMRGPACRWQDALPTGNGAIGAMMHGQIQAETILLNHEALYYPRKPGTLVDVSDQVPKIRSLLDQGKYAEAKSVFAQVHAERSGIPEGSTSTFRDPYQPFCDVRLGTSTDGPFLRYRRGVDFETGRIWTRWEDGNGETVREVFVSRANDTVYVRIRSERPGCVHHRVRLERHAAPEKDDGWAAPKNLDPADCTHRAEEGGWLFFESQYVDAYAFGAVGQVTASGGELHIDGEDVVVDGADELVLRVKLFVREDPESAVARLRQELVDQSADFDAALAAHSEIHRAVFDRMELVLDSSETVSNEELLLEAYDGEASNALIQKMFDYGRYLLICSSRSGGCPANLQGIWNGDYAPAWNSDFHSDENIQMNYWQALQGNMAELLLPMFDYYERYLDDFRENARKLYGTRGIYIPIAQTTHGVECPAVWSNWTAAAGWLAQHFYDYYLFTEDEIFLAERAVPWMKEVAWFYEDFLYEGPDGRLVFAPSVSPENRPPGDGMDLVTINATMDVAICRELLSNLCEACETLAIDADSVTRWQEMLSKLPAYEVNEDGAMREWLHPAFKDNYHHRHQSHIYPVFPGIEITPETDADLFAACRVAVEKRLVIGLTSQSGWSMAHMANIYARLGEGDRALECVEILTRSSTGPNLFTYHNDWRSMGLSLGGWGRVPPFQIDANFGIAAAVLEMLVFSKPGLIKLLPALPDRWDKGQAKGLACRGGVTVDVEWDRSEGFLRATLMSQTDRDVVIKLPEGTGDLADGSPFGRSDLGETYWQGSLAGGVPVRMEVVV